MANNQEKVRTGQFIYNKGEWSEFYVLLRILSDGRLYAADEKLHKLDQVYFPVIEVMRDESESIRLVFSIPLEKDKPIEVFYNGDRVRRINRDKIRRYSAYLYSQIVSGSNTKSFAISNILDIMEEIASTKIKAPSTDKMDIKLQVFDTTTGRRMKTGFSIKSELGAAPSLLNASGATNFIYDFGEKSEKDISWINSIDTRAKITDRVKAAFSIVIPQMLGAANQKFAGNLMMIDSRMEEIVSYMLLEYYRYGKVFMTDIVTELEKKDPLKFCRPGIYRYKIKKFLSSVALGMTPSKIWNGQDEANGGYIIVKDDGEVLVYHLYNRDFFETYLLNNTKLETGSSKKHGFGTMYEEDGHMLMKLNLQIRFT